MKKITSILLTGLLMVLSFVSCSKDDNTIVIYSCTEDYKNEFYLAEDIIEDVEYSIAEKDTTIESVYNYTYKI